MDEEEEQKKGLVRVRRLAGCPLVGGLLTCSRLVHVVQLIVEGRRSRILFSHHIGNVVEQRLAPVCGLGVQQLHTHTRTLVSHLLLITPEVGRQFRYVNGH